MSEPQQELRHSKSRSPCRDIGGKETQDLRVVVFASENPDFYMARYDLSDPNPVAFAPIASGVTQFIDSTWV